MWLVSLAWLASACASAPAPVDVRVEIDWTAPSSCPDAASLARKVGRDLGAPSAEVAVGFVGRIAQREDGSYVLDYELVSRSGASAGTLASRSCETLTDTAALKLVLAIEAAASQRPLPAASPPAVPTQEPVAAAEPRRAAPAKQPAVELGVTLGAAASTMPAPVAGAIELGLVTAVRRLAVELVGRYLPPDDIPAARRPDRGIRVQVGGIALRGCGRFRSGSVSIGLCGGVEASAVRARGVGVRHPRTSHRPWLAAGPTVQLGWWPRPGFGLWLAGTAAVALTRPRFFIDGIGEVVRWGPIDVRAGGGVALRWPLRPRSRR